MPLIFKERDTLSKERMDDPRCDRIKLFNTYRYFSRVNSLISGWRHIYKKQIRPYLFNKKRSTLLDIGFGGGDIPIKLAQWAAQDDFELNITAIETDERATAYVQTLDPPANVDFKLTSSTNLLETAERFDFVISNHLLHHLSEEEIQQLLKQSKALSKQKVLFNDIERCDIAYLSFKSITTPFFRDSFITEDGLTSIKRSFTYKELRNLAPKEWRLQSLFPSRLLLSYEH